MKSRGTTMSAARSANKFKGKSSGAAVKLAQPNIVQTQQEGTSDAKSVPAAPVESLHSAKGQTTESEVAQIAARAACVTVKPAIVEELVTNLPTKAACVLSEPAVGPARVHHPKKKKNKQPPTETQRKGIEDVAVSCTQSYKYKSGPPPGFPAKPTSQPTLSALPPAADTMTVDGVSKAASPAMSNMNQDADKDVSQILTASTKNVDNANLAPLTVVTKDNSKSIPLANTAIVDDAKKAVAPAVEDLKAPTCRPVRSKASKRSAPATHAPVTKGLQAANPTTQASVMEDATPTTPSAQTPVAKGANAKQSLAPAVGKLQEPTSSVLATKEAVEKLQEPISAVLATKEAAEKLEEPTSPVLATKGVKQTFTPAGQGPDVKTTVSPNAKAPATVAPAIQAHDVKATVGHTAHAIAAKDVANAVNSKKTSGAKPSSTPRTQPTLNSDSKEAASEQMDSSAAANARLFQELEDMKKQLQKQEAQHRAQMSNMEAQLANEKDAHQASKKELSQKLSKFSQEKKDSLKEGNEGLKKALKENSLKLEKMTKLHEEEMSELLSQVQKVEKQRNDAEAQLKAVREEQRLASEPTELVVQQGGKGYNGAKGLPKGTEDMYECLLANNQQLKADISAMRVAYIPTLIKAAENSSQAETNRCKMTIERLEQELQLAKQHWRTQLQNKDQDLNRLRNYNKSGQNESKKLSQEVTTLKAQLQAQLQASESQRKEDVQKSAKEIADLNASFRQRLESCKQIYTDLQAELESVKVAHVKETFEWESERSALKEARDHPLRRYHAIREDMKSVEAKRKELAQANKQVNASNAQLAEEVKALKAQLAALQPA